MAVLSLSRRHATGEDIAGCLVLLQSHLYLGDKLQAGTSPAVLSCYKVPFYLGDKLQERTSLAVLSCYKVTFI